MDDRTTSIPLLLSSRCRVTLKGRLHMDPARSTSPALASERRMQLNETARFVIERCNGLLSVAEVARDVAQTWRVSEAQAARDVLAFLEMLRLHGLVHVEGGYGAPT